MRRATIELVAERAKATVEIELRTRESVPPHLTIDLDLIGTYTELAICMRGRERVNGRWQETVSGQGRDFVREMFRGDSQIEELCDHWQEWHLNGMRAGHREQRRLLMRVRAELDRLHKDRGSDRFTLETELLTMANKNPCHGYKYGSAWLVEPIPWIVLERIERLVAELGGRFVENTAVA